MSQADKAGAFAALHIKGNPLVLYNIWDAGSARAVEKAGAAAVATGSWSVAAAQGYRDGEALPLDLLVTIVERIAATVDVPLSVDFEGGFAEAPAQIEENTRRIVAAGAIGVNFEDQVVGGEGLHDAARQAERIAAVCSAGEASGVPLFVNARTDLFLKEQDRGRHADLVDEAIERSGTYARAGASGFFVPGLVDPDLINTICQASALPVNIMMMPDAPTLTTLAGLGVARISYGPGPYREAVKAVADRYSAISG
ncbi:isocitrate lyase/phosphoenolpyruvate mutase family protein [Nitratireductor sp. XY-223]|uniref:isocitrate lyase/PEP mutase family protein n=1 Tax=Nitratireductor sp. XY-223 TaxID=2561926 RepID=UPI0010A99B33|nr:isocitrate lyase/phosphoenolpyruvate mutase family protein [Nitratireductor sp. XY-223]